MRRLILATVFTLAVFGANAEPPVIASPVASVSMDDTFIIGPLEVTKIPIESLSREAHNVPVTKWFPC